MELIFMYIKSLENRDFKNTEINFSRRYSCSVHENRLLVKKNNIPSHLQNFYGDNIKNITLLLGDNGVGKTTILDCIGLPFNDRLGKFKKNDSFFLVYMIDDNNYLIEIKNCDVLHINENVRSINPEFTYIGRKNGNFIEICGQYKLSNTNNDYITFYYGDMAKQFYKINTNKKQLDNDEVGSFWFSREKLFFSNSGLFRMCNSEIIKEFESFKNKNFVFSFSTFLIIEYFYDDLIMKNTYLQNFNNLFNYAKSNMQKLIVTYLYNLFKFLFQNKYCETIFDREGNRKYVVNNNYSENLSNAFKSKQSCHIESYESSIDYLLNMLSILSPLGVETEKIKKFLYAMERIDASTINHNLMTFSITEYTDNNIAFFKEYDEIGGNEYSFNYTIYESLSFELNGMSSGETHLLSFLSCLDSIRSRKYDKKPKGVTILLDEPEEKFHPEWNRRLMKYIIKMINSDNSHVDYSVIIASHSPFFASDILKEDILCLQKKSNFIFEKKELTQLKNDNNVIITKSNFGFGSEISDILSNDFFMEYHIGEFAKEKIIDLKKEICSIESDKNIEKIMKKISCICDERIAIYLIDMLSKATNNEIYKLRMEREILDKKIKDLERKK